MDDINLTVRISESRSICIAPLPFKSYKEAGAKGLGGEYGYFIFEVDESSSDAGINVIGKAASIDAALRLYEIIARCEQSS
jgi:hypothetical protein